MLGLGQAVLDGCGGGFYAGLMNFLDSDEFQMVFKHLYIVKMDGKYLERMGDVYSSHRHQLGIHFGIEALASLSW